MSKGGFFVVVVVVGALYLASSHTDAGPKTDENVASASTDPIPPMVAPTDPMTEPVPKEPEVPVEAPPVPDVGENTPGVPPGNTPDPPPEPEDGARTNGPPKAMVFLGLSNEADRDGSVNGCKGGHLELSGSTLSFRCPAPNEDKDVTLAAEDVKCLDKNGVESQRGDKYHFHLTGLDEATVANVFSAWMVQARTTPTPVCK